VTGAPAPRPSDRAALRGLPPTVRDAKGRVRHESLTDALTELPNRLHFDVVYRLLWEAGSRGIPVTLLRFDLPGLGQAPADVQRKVGDRLNLITRQMDMIARLDPDHFGVLLMDCNAFGGMVAAERFGGDLHAILGELGIPFHSGLAAWKDWMTHPDDLLSAAEEALQVASAHGGDRIEVHHR
jgi:GGDEF domain-containing protein